MNPSQLANLISPLNNPIMMMPMWKMILKIEWIESIPMPVICLAMV